MGPLLPNLRRRGSVGEGAFILASSYLEASVSNLVASSADCNQQKVGALVNVVFRLYC
jgi:hypothetical protein